MALLPEVRPTGGDGIAVTTHRELSDEEYIGFETWIGETPGVGQMTSLGRHGLRVLLPNDLFDRFTVLTDVRLQAMDFFAHKDQLGQNDSLDVIRRAARMAMATRRGKRHTPEPPYQFRTYFCTEPQDPTSLVVKTNARFSASELEGVIPRAFELDERPIHDIYMSDGNYNINAAIQPDIDRTNVAKRLMYFLHEYVGH